MRIGENQFEGAVVALDTAVNTDVLTFTPALPCRIVRFGYCVTVALDNTADALILALDTQGVGATDPARAEQARITATVDEAVGTVRYHDWVVNDTTDETWELAAGLGNFVVMPGHQVILETVQDAISGDGLVWIEYTPLSWSNINNWPAGDVHIPVEVTG
jgi:hypothetical protein